MTSVTEPNTPGPETFYSVCIHPDCNWQIWVGDVHRGRILVGQHRIKTGHTVALETRRKT